MADKTPFQEISHIKKRAFLSAFAETGSVVKAAAVAQVTGRIHYVWLKEDEKYKELFETARLMACDIWEDEARRRAIDGVNKPVIYRGQITDTYKDYSDILTMFILKANNPDKYKDRTQTEVTADVNITLDTKAEIQSRIDSIAAKMGA